LYKLNIKIFSIGCFKYYSEQLKKGNASLSIYNTLLEQYLEKMNKSQANQNELKEKTLEVLYRISDKNYSTDEALVLCQMNNFEEGTLYLYESAGLYQQILRYHMEKKSFDRVIDTCRQYGTKDTTLWHSALTYYAQEQDGDCRHHIGQVIKHIDNNNILPPLLVIQMLSNSPNATLGLVKDYLLRRVLQGGDEIKKCEGLIEECRNETENMQNRIEDLKCSASTFQETRCSCCHQELELPSVHFLCQHAYHEQYEFTFVF